MLFVQRLSFICLLGTLTFLISCGFQPAYDSKTAEKLTQVKFAPMADREGQILRSALVQAFDPTGLDLLPKYEFSGRWTTNTAPLLSEGSDIRGARGTMTLIGEMRDLDGKVLWSGQVSRSALFAQHVLPSISAEAEERLWQDLAALLAQDLILAVSGTLE